MKWLIHTEAKGPVIRANREVGARELDGHWRAKGAVIAALGIWRHVNSHVGTTSECGEAKGRAGGAEKIRKVEVEGQMQFS